MATLIRGMRLRRKYGRSAGKAGVSSGHGHPNEFLAAQELAALAFAPGRVKIHDVFAKGYFARPLPSDGEVCRRQRLELV